MDSDPVLPDHGGRCVSSLVPAAVTGHGPEWLSEVTDARQVVLLVVDGLGWNQLRAHAALAPTMAAGARHEITTVAPSTTASALASITTGVAPGEHGLVGYRVRTHAGILNCLRWTASGGDARDRVPPEEMQPVVPFLGTAPPVLTRAEFAATGFTTAHLRSGRLHGWYAPMAIATDARRALTAGERLVYAYYDGLDKTAHAHGLADHYLDELRFVDHLVDTMRRQLPDGAVLVVTADHGFVDVGSGIIELAPQVRACLDATSGEARFLWLHARPGREAALAEAAGVHADTGWVATAEQILDEGWFGSRVLPEARRCFGDVALVAREPIAYGEPGGPDTSWLKGRHGGLTADEMLVPFIVLGPAEDG